MRVANRLIILFARFRNNSLNSFCENVGLPSDFANGNQKFIRPNHRPIYGSVFAVNFTFFLKSISMKSHVSKAKR